MAPKSLSIKPFRDFTEEDWRDLHETIEAFKRRVRERRAICAECLKPKPPRGHDAPAARAAQFCECEEPQS